jgi:hypothetical protein
LELESNDDEDDDDDDDDDGNEFIDKEIDSTVGISS